MSPFAQSATHETVTCSRVEDGAMPMRVTAIVCDKGDETRVLQLHAPRRIYSLGTV